MLKEDSYSSAAMRSLDQLFVKNIFRIPDYQRGYSWKNDELDDFWQDLLNLQEKRQHYTGMITIEPVGPKQFRKWKNEDWLIKTSRFEAYYIVDGQQRITTIVILLQNLLDHLANGKTYMDCTKAQITEKYLFKRSASKNLTCYFFGYEIDDPSYEYLKKKIFRQESLTGSQPETSYTNNLGLCNKFFDTRLAELSHEERELIFRKVTQQLMFDIKVVTKELDIFVVFETMNNRGKELTNLEKLKNRLIYLSTLMPGVKENEEEQLRNEINTVWKSCYEYLGKDKANSLDDDIFLRNHFVLYHFFNKEKGFPYHQLFKEIYTVKNTVNKVTETRYKEVKKYITNLQKAAKQWYIINNPEHAFTNGFISSADEKDWLIKIKRLGLRIFGPLTLAVYLTTDEEKDRVDYLKAIESFIFLVYYCAGRKSTLGNTDFSNIANYLYKKQENWDIKKVIAELYDWIYGDENNYGNYSTERFIANIKDQFLGSKNNGYYDWPGLRYLLFEYDEYIRGREETKVKWSLPNSIEHIYPQTPTDITWKNSFAGFSPKQQRYLCNSLGNLVLLGHSKNSSLSNNSFDKKKKIVYSSGNISGFYIGSHSEIEVAQNKKWQPKEIFHRGLKIFDFLTKNWKIELTRKQIKELLLIDENLMKRFR